MATLVPGESSRADGLAVAVNGSALTEADFRGCRWIEGAPKPLRHGMFCGRPVPEGESWCPRHRSVVYGEAAEPSL